MATTVGTVNLSGCSYSLAYDLISQDVATNSSVVRLYGILTVTNNYVSWSSGSASVHTESTGIGTNYAKGSHTLITRDFTWAHDSNGNFSMWIGAALSTTFVSGNTGGVITLPRINRVAITNSVEGNDIEGNFKVNYTKNIDSYTYKLRISIPNIMTLQTTEYNTSGANVTLNNESLTQILTSITGNSINLGFRIETWNGGTRISEGNEIIKTCYLYNAEPTYDVAYEDTNATTTAITQDDQKIIRNNSTLQVNLTNIDAKKSSTISSIVLTIDGNTYNGYVLGTTCTINVGTLNLSSDTEASITVTDSRGLSTTKTFTITILDWELPTGIVTMQRQSNYYSETDITVDASYSSLDGDNQLTIKLRYKKTSDANYGTYTTLQNNTSTTFTLDNLYAWNIQVVLEDLLGTTTINQILGTGKPIFYIDRLKNSVGVECFPQYNNSLEVNGVDRSNVYSTTEKPIGFWIDGKIIYRKVIELQPHDPSSGSGYIVHVNHNISNLDKVINIYSTVQDSYNGNITHKPLPMVSNTNYSSQMGISINSTQINLLGEQYSSFNVGGFIVIEYTKSSS